MQVGIKFIKDDAVNTKLLWDWSVQEQLILLDRHDAYWINEAKNNWKFKDSERQPIDVFLSIYGLRRGSQGQFWNKKFQRRKITGANLLIELAKDYFKPELPNKDYWVEADKRWKEVINRLPGDHKLYSATSKMFWFYHPEKLTMFDSYALKGLKKFCLNRNQKVTRENFYGVFQEFYELNIENIKTAISRSNRNYKYLPRIADKYLWLMGSDIKDEVKLCLKEGIKLAPRRES